MCGFSDKGSVKFTSCVAVPVLMLCFVLFAGCTTNIVKSNLPSGAYGQVLYQGPTLNFNGSQENDENNAEVALLARGLPFSPPRYFLTVNVSYEGHWRNYIRAVDDSGKYFQGVGIDNRVRCELFCTYYDTVEIEIDSTYIIARANKGMVFWLTGPATKSSITLSLPSGYIEDVLQKASIAARSKSVANR